MTRDELLDVLQHEREDFERVLDGAPLDTAEDAITFLCRLKSLVAHSSVSEFPLHAADCFCRMGPPAESFRHQGDELRFIAEATLRALREATSARRSLHARSMPDGSPPTTFP